MANSNHQIAYETLRKIAAREAQRQREREADIAQARAELRFAYGLGAPITRLATAAGITRKTA